MLWNMLSQKQTGLGLALWPHLNWSTKRQYLQNSRFGILSKTGADAKKMFTDKVVPISVNYPFFFQARARRNGSPQDRACLPSSSLQINSTQDRNRRNNYKKIDGLDNYY